MIGIAVPSFASEVYIDQAGNSTNVNVLQQYRSSSYDRER
jgi:hypothetical protein